MMKKNDELELFIEDMTMAGEGIGKHQGFPLFVKDAIVGDTILAAVTKLKKNYGYARVVKVISPSKDRIEPPCPKAQACGGCTLMAMTYEKQLEFKRKLVMGNLSRIGGLSIENVPIMGMENPYRYRNKAQYPVGVDKNGHIVMGFYASRTHSIIPCEDCLIGSRVNASILATIREFMEENRITAYQETTGQGLVRHILIREGYATGEVMVCLVINGEHLPQEEALAARLSTLILPEADAFENAKGDAHAARKIVSVVLNHNTKNTNVILGERCTLLWGRDYIEDYIGNVKFQISAQSFFQVNPVQTQRLYETALSYADITKDDVVWDLYCGIGTISLFLARHAKEVYGVEIVAPAIEDARRNAMLNGITNAHFYVGKAEEVAPRLLKEEHVHADVVVVDPPRKGCEESLLETIAQMSPRRVVYVSCDCATLARDLKILTGMNYEVTKVQAVDQFAHSTHVETVCLLNGFDIEQRR